MSKTSVKKALFGLTAAQLTELICELYDSKLPAKDYLDFFADPDVDKAIERAKKNVAKEFSRSSRGRNKTRVTRVRRMLKDFSSMNPGAEPILELMVFAVVTAVDVAKTQWMKETVQNGVARLMSETVCYADRHGLLSLAVGPIEEAVESLPAASHSLREYKRLLQAALKAVMADL